MALLSQKLSQKPGASEESALREKLFATNGEYLAFVKKLEQEYPDYFNLKFNRASPSITQLQKLIRPSQAVVSYFIAEKGRRLYTFVLTPKSFHLFHSTLPEDFEKLIRGFTNSLYYMTEDIYRESAGRLGPLLLRGVPSAAEIIFIPSGRLGTVPFEALPYKKLSQDSNFETFPYLINRSSVSYEFSAGLLLQKSNHPPVSNQASIFLAAPVTFPEKDDLDDLPATEQEVKTISSLFTSGAKVVLGKDANESLVKSGNLADYRYLHFATHGIVDETSPELSRIYLQSSAGDDGNVFSGEIFNLKLNADLCVLSACQTGLGKYSKGEGVIGLSRALVYAGARSIMVSYWSVADASTAELMLDFYQILLHQPVPNTRLALQQAKVNMLKKKKFASPYYWAPFVLIGAQ
jgi:CHAT domain-containing protein